MTRILISLAIFIVLLISGLLAYIDYGPVSVLPILQYQHIGESESRQEDYIHPRAFSDQMKYLADEEFKVITLDDVVQIYKEKGEVPTHTIAITFDGGYSDFNEYAVPALAKYKFPVTVFLQSGNMGKPGFMTKDQIIKLAEENERITFGSNGMSGKNLNSINGADAYNEISSSKIGLQKELEIIIPYFSYPQGGFMPTLERLVQESGYRGACALTPGRNYSNHNPFIIKRTAITYADDNPVFFKLKTWGNYVILKEWKEDWEKKRNRRKRT